VVTYALEVILIAWLVTRGDEVVDEGLLELCPAIELVLRQAQEPLMTGLIKNNWKIISHYVFIARSWSDGDLIKCDLVLEVLLAIVLPELFELEVLRPYNLLEMRSELF
jgi:hypothetical protein